MTPNTGARRSRLSRTQVGTLQMLTGTVLISFSAVFVKVAHVGPTTAGFYRMFFGASFLLLIGFVKRQTLWRGWKPLGLAVAAGLFFGADLSSWHRSIHYVGPGLATILANFQVFFLAAVGVLVFKEKASWRFFVSVPLAVAGLFLLVGVDWDRLEPRYKLGVVLGLFCAVMYTFYLLVLRRSQRRPRRLDPTPNLTIISVVTTVLLAAAVYAQGEGFIP